jgi:membrane dipeptidase
MIGAIGDLDGVVGLNLFNGFLFPEWEAVILGRILPQALRGPVTDVPVKAMTLEAVGAHAKHIADLVGWHRVGVGSDLDGGLGADETPAELDTIADLHRVADVVPPEARAGVLGENWLRFLTNALP